MKKSTGTIILAILLSVLLPALACALSDKEQLGKLLYEDINLSLNHNQSCESCHEAPGFADQDNADDPANLPVSEGSVDGLYGGRNAPSSAYAASSPRFSYVDGVGYVGGQFWDGRAKGLKEQAKGPFLNPVEMAMPNSRAVVEAVIAAGVYDDLFLSVYGVDLNSVKLVRQREVNRLYDLIADAIATYERSVELNKFNSRYDEALAGVGSLSEQELAGQALFSAHCSQCHPATGTDCAHRNCTPPVFSTFAYHNLGLPHNDRVDELTGAAPATDLGLGGRADIDDPAEYGKFKTPTLRNIALTAPYGHNGVFPSLKAMVGFLNDRSGFTPDVADNVTDAVGNLGLAPDEVEAIVAFLNTLSDQ